MPEAHDRDQIYDTDQPAMERHPNHVLVIEDEESHAELIRRGFKSYHQDFHLTFAGSLMDARNRINKNLPDLIIADWLLPDGKGIEILPSDREAITIPVIIMTSHGNEELAVEMLKAGVVDYIVKSENSFRELPHIAERALRDWGNIVQRKRAQEALMESEEKFRSLVEHALEGILILDLQGTILFANNATTRTLEVDDREGLIGRNVMEFVAPESREDVVKDFIEVSHGHDAYLAQYNVISEKGNKLWVENIGKVISYEGKPADLVSFRDITERKRAEETIKSALAEKEVLLREIHHRVKNNLAGIISLIDLQIGSVSDPVIITLLKDLETRIRSMALVHESLYRTEDLTHISFTHYTEELTQYLFRAYGTQTDIRCRIEMGDVTMPIETAIPCGLVTSEIVTNSLKYAFPRTFSCEEIRGEPCTIALTLHRDGSDYLLKITDNGTGIPERNDVTMSHSLGLFLIRFIVEHQLRGSLEVSTAGGTAYTIRFPAPEVKERNNDE